MALCKAQVRSSDGVGGGGAARSWRRNANQVQGRGRGRGEFRSGRKGSDAKNLLGGMQTQVKANLCSNSRPKEITPINSTDLHTRQ